MRVGGSELDCSDCSCDSLVGDVEKGLLESAVEKGFKVENRTEIAVSSSSLSLSFFLVLESIFLKNDASLFDLEENGFRDRTDAVLCVLDLENGFNVSLVLGFNL